MRTKLNLDDDNNVVPSLSRCIDIHIIIYTKCDVGEIQGFEMLVAPLYERHEHAPSGLFINYTILQSLRPSTWINQGVASDVYIRVIHIM